MTPFRRHAAVAIAVLVAASSGRAAAQPADAELALSPLEVRRRIALAEHLHEREQLYREIGVLEELRVLAPTRDLSVWARLRIAVAYHQAAQYADAVAEYDALLVERVLAADVEDLAHVQRTLAMAAPIIHEAGHPGADALLAELLPLTDRPGEVGALAGYHRARLAAVTGDRRTATLAIEGARSRCGTGLAPCAAVEALAARIDDAPPSHRSPALALVLSAVVPGAGSMYSRHWVDGFYYLGLTGLTALGAIDSYDPDRARGDQSATFYGLATLAAAFYVTNLVHAYGAAKRYNRVEAHRWRERMWSTTELPLPLAGRPAPAIE